MRKLHLSLVRVVLVSSKTIEAITVVLGFLSETYDQSLLLKTVYTLNTGLRSFKLDPV